MNKSKAIASAYKNGYLKTLNTEQEMRTAVKNFIENSKEPTSPQEMIILSSASAGVKVVRNPEGKVITEIVNY